VEAVLDVNVIVSALLAPGGTPARIIEAWQDGQFDIVVSPLLLAEFGRAVAYPKLAGRIAPVLAERMIDWLTGSAILVDDPAAPPPLRSVDPDDDYLLALAAQERALLVTGDAHLLSLDPRLPIKSPAEFLALLNG
jgi:putative PIN family toxin of toxin-antitoxin system